MSGPSERLGELLRAGRFDEAIAIAEQGAAASPGNAAAWSALAGALAAARRPEAALGAWDQALLLAPDAPELLSGKGAVLQGLGRLDEARALYGRALAKDPGQFQAAFALALLAVEAGDWAEADARAAGLRARHPDLPNLRWLSARVAMGRRDFAEARMLLGGLTGDPRLAPEQRADALLLLSEALDAEGHAPEAFDAAVAGKAILRQLYAERARGREGAVARFERLAAWFKACDPTPWGAAPSGGPVEGEAAAHVFLVGFPRSGTTLLEQALAGHPDVVTLEEAPTLAAAHAEFMGSPAGLERLARLGPDEAAAWRARYWTDVAGFGVSAEGRLFVDKAPAGTIDLPLVAKLFPRARVLFALRDPRDVVLSCLRQSFQMNAMTYAFTDLADAAACYAAGMALAEVYRARLPLPWMDVRHEALIADFEAGLAKICAFLDLAPHPAMTDVAATAARRAVRTPSAPQVRAGLSLAGVGRWRAYGDQLQAALPLLAPWVRRFGYDEA